MTDKSDQPAFGEDSLQLLEDLSNASGVSGAEGAVRAIIVEALEDLQLDIRQDDLGNVIAHRPARADTAKKVMLAVYMDEAGLMIRADEGDGLYSFAPVGEVDVRQLPGKSVLVGKNRVPGVIGARAIHLTTAAERKAAIPLAALRIDVGPQAKAELGDRAVFATRFWRQGETLFGKALDNRLGVVVLLELLKQAPDTLDLYAVFSSQKKIGGRGEMVAAFDINPDFVILVEAADAADLPAGPNGELGSRYESRLGGGPVIFPMQRKIISDPKLFEVFIAAAKRAGIPFQVGQAGTLETRAEAWGSINKIREGMRAIHIGIPVRYAGTPINLARRADWNHTFRLLLAGIKELESL